MKKSLVAIAILALFSYGVYAVFSKGVTSVDTPAPSITAVPSIVGRVVAEAKVVPMQSAALSFQTGGVVDQVLVKVGDHVQNGQPLAWLDTSLQRAAVSEAEADLAQAQANYQDLHSGASPEEVTVAEAQLRQAQAQLQATSGSVTPEDIRAAEAQLQQARAQLERLVAGPKMTDLRAIEAKLALAQANLQAERDQLSAGKSNAQSQLDQATNALTQAQANYSTVKQNWQYVQDTGRDPITPWLGTSSQTGKKIPNTLSAAQRQQYQNALVQAEAAMHSAEKAVQIAQITYNNARQAEVSGIQAAEQQVAISQADLDKLRAGADLDQLAAARAQIASSQANLDKLRGDQRGGTVTAAQAAVDVAQAQLERIRAGATQSKLAIAQAQVQRAQAALDRSRAALDLQQLRAPFDAVVASVDSKVGEYAPPGTPAIRIADMTSWQLETDDLTERNITHIRAGAPVTVTLDAIVGLNLSGKVQRIAPFGQDIHGDTTYTVVIALDQQDERLRWNMTATVYFDAAGE